MLSALWQRDESRRLQAGDKHVEPQAAFWFSLRVPFAAVIPVFWLFFALEYSGRGDWRAQPPDAWVRELDVLADLLTPRPRPGTPGAWCRGLRTRPTGPAREGGWGAPPSRTSSDSAAAWRWRAR